MNTQIGQRYLPRVRFAAGLVETSAVLHGLQQPTAVAVGLDPGAERLAAMAAIDGVAHHPRQLRLCGRAAILNPVDLHDLHRPDHHASPPAVSPSLTASSPQFWEGLGMTVVQHASPLPLTWSNTRPERRVPKPCAKVRILPGALKMLREQGIALS